MQKNIGKKLAFDRIMWDGTSLQLTFSKNFSYNEDLCKLLIQNRNGNKRKLLEYKCKEYPESYKFIIPTKQMEELEKGRWDFFVELASGKTASQKRIGLYDVPVTSEPLRYLNPINNNGKYSFIPYLTEKNGLSIHCGNLLQLEDKSYDVVQFPRKVKRIEETATKVMFSFKEPLSGDAKDMQLIMKSGDDVCLVPMRLDSKREGLVVDKKELKPLRKKQKWNVYLQVIKGNILERYELNIQAKTKNQIAFAIKKQGEEPQRISRQTIKGNMLAENLRIQNEYIVFDVAPKELKYAHKIEFYLKKRKAKDKIILDVKRSLHKGKEQIKMPLSQLQNEIVATGRWDLSVELHHEHVKEVRRIGHYNVTYKAEADKHVGYVKLHEEIGVAPYLTADNEFSFYFCTEEQYVNAKYPANAGILDLSMNKAGLLQFTAGVTVKETNDFAVDHVVLRLRNDKSKVFHIPCTEESLKDGYSRKIKAEFNLSEVELEQFYWDFFICVTLKNKEKRLIRLRNDKYSIRLKLKHQMLKYSITNQDGYMAYPYTTANDCLSITYRQTGEFESLKYKVNEYTAYFLYNLLFWYFNWKPIWLIHEKYSETAQDNSFYFFKHCYENYYDKKVYYVIKKGSADEQNLIPYKNRVVYFMSIKHLLLLLASRLIVASETKGHGYAWRVSNGVIRDFVDQKKYVFLQHGVLGLKRVDNTFKVNSSNGAELFVVSSDFEKKIVEDYFGYKKENIIVTGLSRWDVVQDRSQEMPRKEIFLMPTWRNWLEEVEEEQFVQSDYYREYNGVLQSEKFLRVLKENNVVLNFYVHPKFMPYVSNFTSSNEHINVIQFGEEKINDLLMRSSLLITDYSSVAWEMYYQKKPILFFHFDLEQYVENQGSYMDLKQELFGDVSYSASELVDKLSMYIENGFQEKEEFSAIRHDYFKYVDHNNSARIYREIIKREDELTQPDSLLVRMKKNYLIRSLWRKSKEIPLVHRISRRILMVLE
ncbi:CDP-glycerol glycerophosphotransferase family protein [Ectobacillus funiculus]|uniref:CDP-glycerol glycerophosphotransferase family protein n=1 Tax=Ectobacillus funiculus TaxID=137993 RepID=A0ABV5WJZ2_9BACI